ncbi:MAG TPA: DNA replication and repair protein RecF [Gemmatimonadales bacterium]|nr:DNA replication and repair protein RecF [Gemmatimonadales bacterium]
MRLRRLVAHGFRNLADLDCFVPGRGLALLGANAQGKTNFLEAVYYPVLFRSFREAPDQEVAGFGAPGFHVEASVEESGVASLAAGYQPAGRRKRILLDGDEPERLAEAVGRWLAVVFLPGDVDLASGPATLRRQYLDRLLSLADRGYLRALARYRAALAQRNSALRQGRPELAWAFDGPLASAGAEIVAARERWVRQAGERFAAELDCIGERGVAGLTYRGAPELADPGAWAQALRQAMAADRARCASTVGPHRDDLTLEIAGRPIREYGSTGQHRSAAVALKLLEMTTLREARDTEPALLLDDVFAELDDDRRQRLAARLIGPEERQVFLTAPRREELPRGLGLEVWSVTDGRVAGPRPLV